MQQTRFPPDLPAAYDSASRVNGRELQSADQALTTQYRHESPTNARVSLGISPDFGQVKRRLPEAWRFVSPEERRATRRFVRHVSRTALTALLAEIRAGVAANSDEEVS